MKIANFYCFGLIGENDPLFKIFTGEEDPIISSKKVSDFLQALDSDITDIHVHINSRGGSVDEGFAIHDLLVNSGKKITTIVEGQASSIASVVLFAGSVRQITENSKVMIHNPWIDPTLIAGLEADELQSIADDMKREETRILDFYAKKTGMATNKIAEMMKDETTFDASTALEMKFVTEIVKPVKALAYFNYKKQNQNNTLMSEVKNEVKTLGQRLDAFIASFKKDKNIQDSVGKELKITTADNIELTVDDSQGVGKPTINAGVKDKDGKNVPSQTFKMPDGTEITTDAQSKISAIKEPELVQDAQLKAENETLKAKLAALEAEQTANAQKIDWIMKNVSSTFTPPADKQNFRPLTVTEINIKEEAKARKETYKQPKSKQVAQTVN